MSNLGLEVALRERGARLVRVQVGDRYVVEEMRQHGYNLGGEQSGHLIFLDHGTTGDGLLAALQVLRLMVERQRPLSELKRVMTRFPQVLLNVPVQARRDLDGGRTGATNDRAYPRRPERSWTRAGALLRDGTAGSCYGRR